MTITLSDLDKNNFPGIKLYLMTAFLFLDVGILFGALNALRLADVFKVPEIHQTHWTSTLFGAITILLIGQSYNFFCQINKGPNKLHKLIYVTYALLLIGIASSYLSVWVAASPFAFLFVYSLKLAITIHLINVFSFLLSSDFRKAMNENPSIYLLMGGMFWMGVAIIVFLNTKIYLNPLFKIAFIYGFFASALFGTLSLVLPMIFELAPRTKKRIMVDVVLFNGAAILYLLDEGLDIRFIFGFFASIFWGLAGFMFILWVFDIVYKVGIKESLVGVLVALVFFGFFVFDNFMKIVFPQWVSASHVHFMFLGTLVLTIISIGVKLISFELEMEEPEEKGSKLFRDISIGLAVASVGGVLLSFTIQNLVFASFFGFSLFVTIILTQILLMKNRL